MAHNETETESGEIDMYLHIVPMKGGPPVFQNNKILKFS